MVKISVDGRQGFRYNRIKRRLAAASALPVSKKIPKFICSPWPLLAYVSLPISKREVVADAKLFNVIWKW
jgi:hypothetical protein